MKIVSVEDVVAKHQGRAVVAYERLADDEGLRQAIRRGLHGVLQVQPPRLAGTEQLLETRSVLRRGDDQDVAYSRQHQRAERIVDHRLVEHRQQLLADGQRGRMQAGAGATGEDDAFSHVLLFLIRLNSGRHINSKHRAARGGTCRTGPARTSRGCPDTTARSCADRSQKSPGASSRVRARSCRRRWHSACRGRADP